jgi:hypothetical protein
MVPSAEAIAEIAGGTLGRKEIEEIAELLERFIASDTCKRLAQARDVRREQRFGFMLEGLLITGALDVIAREPSNRTLVVDYKSDRLEAIDPAEVLVREYSSQQLIYALAALRAGAEQVEVVHVFLELPDEPVVATFASSEVQALEQRLTALTRPIVGERAFPVTDAPHRALCEGCPAQGGLCSWPIEQTRRETADRLF